MQIIAIIGSNLVIILTFFGLTWSILSRFRTESREDWKMIHQEMKEFKEAVRMEMKDFHERLLKIESERKK